ncbi:hypothetical protein COCSUDRAFT_42394 [Coccomyxa subellipsoidea C-169]|uniref:Cation/H+ exchanger domain-containing protein n=1 Tax=Coccomyxa subellipsoidea (strain C-169) TaxID=574566 RepID=I0YWK4_COCSC|nr:hypothetical protein COCSUDRAFT_42394 [Coccomyxa subellipsoidea C-169]EIE22773.1 hypothetical protein COCSUDRAFT_42394 [Coccomyxa subellipsoidea C-169]|eukprot:XP_005647317.1 hypothetical protein COCSUDRAFT_42394 [Coccomyxa subellipsoidea C-169]
MDGYSWIHFLVLALLAPVLLLCGTAAQLVRLPLITGYVLGGIIVGPYCLRILNADALQALAVVDHACLAIIAFSAGAELQVGDVRRIKKQIAVLKETGGRGPYSSLVMAVIIVKDVVVFICFAVNIEVSDVVMRKSGEGFGISILLEPVVSLAVSTVLGLMFGVLIGRLLAAPARPFNVLLRRLPHPAQSRGEAASKAIHEDLGIALTHLMPLVNMAFFSLAGASLLLGRVVATLWVAVAVYAVRLLAVYLGSRLGAWVGGTPTEHRRKVWQGMITQAGVAMGLAKAVAVRFPAWGPDFVFLMDWSSSCYHPVTQRCAGVVVVQMSVIMMNLFSGPPMFRSAVISTGEARALQLPSVANDAGFPSPKKLMDSLDDEEPSRQKHSPSGLHGRSESL